MRLRKPRSRLLVAATAVAIAAPFAAFSGSVGVTTAGASNSDDAHFMAGNKLMTQPQEAEGQGFQDARDAYFADRVFSGTQPLSVEQAAQLHDKGAAQARALGRGKKGGSSSSSSSATPGATISGAAPLTSGPPWQTLGPIRTQQVARTSGGFEYVSGRISALAVDPAGNIYAGAAGGGVWKYNGSQWTALTDGLPTLAVGAIAIDPADANTIYLGTGEADLSGDSHFGDGIWKSTDGGQSWTHLGQDANGNYAFDTSTISRLIVTHINGKTVLYVATLRGRGGERRVSPPTSQTWGIYRSNDGGNTWALLKGTTDPSHGATDLEVDPSDPTVLYASFWGDGIYTTNNSSQTQWHQIMNGLPNGQYAAGGTRFSIAVAPLTRGRTRIYAGFDWYDQQGNHHPSQLFRSDNSGSNWQALPTTGEGGGIDSVSNYCDIQCSYDNVVMVDPTNPDIVYAAGEYNYGLASGGIYRSVNGGLTWQSLGFDLHPDFHALAFQPGNEGHIVIGNDGGVWQSPDRGGRPFSGGDLTQTDWQDLNQGLTITQFDSIDYASSLFPNRYWGGTQDNGTQRKSSASSTWFDLAGGDGGQVLVDHNDTNPNTQWAFGEYYGISPYRFQDASCCFGDIAGISRGINTNDRSEFYAPWIMNQANGNQLFYGTFRVYRTDNAETDNPGDVVWQPISGDLTSGCTGAAPNGGRNCTITALGHSEGGNALWVGTQEGYVWVSPNAGISDNPTWTRVDTNGPGGQLANRPITSFAVDRSNWRIAYVSYAGYDEATPGHAGHIFKTTNGGQTWTDVTGDLPDGPVNSVILDPSNPNHLIAGTDFGAFTADLTQGAPSWSPVGSGLPAAQVWQLAYDSSRDQLVAGTHGRGAWKLNLGTSAPALVASTADAGTPVGPGKDITYTITVKNEGNADATNVTITQPVPGHTTFDTASDGGTANGGVVTWTGLSIAAGASKQVTYSVKIDPALPGSVTEIDSDGLSASDTSGVSTTGSPFATPISPAHAVTLSTPTPKDGVAPGSSVTYPVTVSNPAYNNDSYTFSTSSTKGWTMTVLQSDCTTALGGGGLSVASGATGTVCVKVDIPSTGVDESSPDSETLTAHSVGDPSVTRDLGLTSIPVTKKALLVDEDGNKPDVQSYYTAAMTSAGVPFAVWDLASDKALGSQYLAAHKEVYWFTGGSYPGPLLPYEGLLKGYLDGGGHLFVSGEDLLDQAAGQTSFVSTYLHINWDGTEAQNDKATATFTGVPSSVVGGTFGAVSKVQVPGLCVCEDEVTPVSPATAQFMDDGAATGSPKADALAVTDSSGAGTYKVVFLAFPFEEFGNASNQAALMTKVDAFFSAP